MPLHAPPLNHFCKKTFKVGQYEHVLPKTTVLDVKFSCQAASAEMIHVFNAFREAPPLIQL